MELYSIPIFFAGGRVSWVSSFVQHNVFEFHPHYCERQYFIPLYCNVIQLYKCTIVCLPIFLLDFWTILSFSKAALSIFVQVFLWAYVCIYLGYIARVELLGHGVGVCLTS